MKTKTIVQFDEKELDITNLEAEIKAVLKQNKIALKNIEESEVYIKPEAKYLVIKINGEIKEFVLD